MKKLFTNDNFFLFATVLSVAGTLFSSAIMYFLYPATNITNIALVLIKACTLVLYLSYIHHSKNVMKGMMGAVLMAQVLASVFYWALSSAAIDKIFSPIFTVLSAALFVNHFLINADRKASPVNIKINQGIVILFTLAMAIWSALWIPMATGTLEAVADVVYIFAFACNMAVVVCVESRLDAYRLDREAAGWTEETGYPKGYVHEYEKK